MFTRGNGPLVSILFPTRGRVEELRKALDSLVSLAQVQANLEFIFKADDDDTPTIEYLNYLKANLPLNMEIIVSPRGRGYHDMHLWVNEMSIKAKGDWLIIWNDDALMQTQNWDTILENIEIDNKRWHGCEDVACLVMNTVNHPGARGFFFLRRKVFEILGRFSLIPHNDTWVTTMMDMVQSCFYVPITMKHEVEQVQDQVRQDSEDARETLIYTVKNTSGQREKLLDAVKLLEHIQQFSSRLPDEIISKYSITDEDTSMLLKTFNEPKGSKIIEIGAHDEPIANILAEAGYDVTGVDLREYCAEQDLGDQEPTVECNYNYIQADFCDLPIETLQAFWGQVDCVIAISALEHFGLGTYKEGPINLNYDIIAMRQIWNLLKEDGTVYITVPFGKDFLEVLPHWRVYSMQAIKQRLCQDFTVEKAEVFVADTCELNGKELHKGDPITVGEAMEFSGSPPHVSMILKLRKPKIHRLSPDGV